MTESVAIRIDLTPCKRVPFDPHDTGTIRLIQVRSCIRGTRDNRSQMRSNQMSGARECGDSPSPLSDTLGAASITTNSTHTESHTLTPRASESNGLELHR